MGTASFSQGNQLSLHGKDSVLLRKIDDDLWQIEELRTKRILEYRTVELQSMYTEGHLSFRADDKSWVGRGIDKAIQGLTAADWELAKLRRTYVLAIIELPFCRELLDSTVKDTWRRIKKPESAPSYVTVHRWRQRYLQAGRDIISLVPLHAGRGNRKSRYPEEVIQIVQQTIQDVYLTLERKTLQDTVDRAAALVSQENRLRPDALQLPLPTRRLVKRYISEIPAFDCYAARYGRTAAIKKFRSVQAHRSTSAPLERAEIDHTLLDLMVIDDNSGLPFGRPWITACIDDYTRCMLGVYISFEPPSHFTVSRCLKQAFLPKIEVLKNYPSIKNEWAAHGVMRELVVDNGAEFHSVSLENACYSLGVELHFSARKTPWFKGKIERFLGTLNRSVAHGHPGTTFSNIFEKDEYDPSKHAVVRFSVLQEIIYTWISDVYHQKVHRTLGVSPSAM